MSSARSSLRSVSVNTPPPSETRGRRSSDAPQHEQMADAAPPHAVKVSGGHAVERHGDRADVVLREHPAEEPPEILLRERHIAENGLALLKRGNDQLPELTVFRRGLKLSGLLKRERALLQMLRQGNVLPERRERGALSARVGRFLSAALERRERRGDAPAQRVDLCKERVALRRDLAAEAVRVLPPWLGARPCRAAQRPEQNVVFQRVAIGAGNAGQTGFQIGKNALVAPAVGKNIECRGDERRKGTGENVGSFARIERHTGAAARLLERGAVIPEAAHRNGNVPPAAGRFAHEPPHLCRGQLALRRDTGCAHEPDAPCGVARLVRPAEEILLKKRKGRAIFAARHGDDLYGHAVLLAASRSARIVRRARENTSLPEARSSQVRQTVTSASGSSARMTRRSCAVKSVKPSI